MEKALFLLQLTEEANLARNQHGKLLYNYTATSYQSDGLIHKQRPAQRTILAEFDLSKAFDPAGRHIGSKCTNNRGRKEVDFELPHGKTKLYAELRIENSKLRVPQGGVLSPIHDLPQRNSHAHTWKLPH